MTSNFITLEIEELRTHCPLKWHDKVPANGVGMGIADIDFKGPPGLVSFLKKNLHDDFSSYGAFEGSKSAIDSGIKYLNSRGIKNPNPKQIQITPGTMMGIFATMKWVSRIDGEISIINPVYPPTINHAKENGNNINWINLTIENEWKIDHEELKSKIDSKTKLLAFNNPNNPTGTLFKEKDLNLIADLSEDFGFTCFVDELYFPLIFKHELKSLSSLDRMQDRCITLHGFSKTYGLAGWRSGFMHINHPDFEEVKYIVEQLIVSPSPVTSLVMEFALSANSVREWQKSFKNQIQTNLNFAVKFFEDNKIPCVNPEGTFFLFPYIQADDIDFKNKLLSKYGVDTVSGSEFGPAGKNYIRVNCATSLERVEKGINKIIECIKSDD